MDFLTPFSGAFRETLEQGIAESAEAPRKVAVFDADGTLWDRDMGEAFLRWLIAMRKLQNVDYYFDLYEEYEAEVAKDRSLGYAYAVQLMAGNRSSDIANWSAAFVAAWPNYRPAMRGLAEGLRELGFETWIISATNHWTVNEAAPYAGVPRDKCQGIQVEVDADKRLTTKLVQPVTDGPGKVEAVKEYIGLQPTFAFGDSLGDYEMMRHARYGLGVEQHGVRKETFREAATRHNWPVHVF